MEFLIVIQLLGNIFKRTYILWNVIQIYIFILLKILFYSSQNTVDNQSKVRYYMYRNQFNFILFIILECLNDGSHIFHNGGDTKVSPQVLADANNLLINRSYLRHICGVQELTWFDSEVEKTLDFKGLIIIVLVRNWHHLLALLRINWGFDSLMERLTQSVRLFAEMQIMGCFFCKK